MNEYCEYCGNDEGLANFWEIVGEKPGDFYKVNVAPMGVYICYTCGSDGARIATIPILHDVGKYECEKCHQWRLASMMAQDND